MSDKMLDKLAKILALAEKASTEEEANAYMQKAQALATTNAIDLAIARQHTAKKEQREQPTHKVITIGEKRKHGNAHFMDLFRNIANNNDVKVNLANDNTFVVVFGVPSDIEVVEVLYASLVFQMVEAANAWLKTGEYKAEKVVRKVKKRDAWGGTWTEDAYAPITAQQARKNFYSGFADRVFFRLADARQQAMDAAKARKVEIRDDQGNTVASSAELVLVGKREEVDRYYTQKSRAKGTWKGVKVAITSTAARSAGDNAGRTARLGSPKAIGGQRTAVAA
ncbi:DUF2786 domain-containing protein [Streptomyces sp. NPDC002088]|uniref:DUF2786 domain-containing protein n=1 Tax=Streptomyces sp. NPDC002088 TaxID=3154665 RepID=UPI00331E81DB